MASIYGRLNLMQGRPEDRAKMEAIADRLAPLFRQQRGFRDVTFFVDEQAGFYGTFSRWDAREDAEAAGEALRAELQRALAGVDLQGPPQIHTVEIYEPKG